MSVIQVRVHLTLCVYLRLLQQYTAGSCISNQTLCLQILLFLMEMLVEVHACIHTYIYTHIDETDKLNLCNI